MQTSLTGKLSKPPAWLSVSIDVQSTIHIETERMLIRGFTPEDVHDLHEILGDDETVKGCEAAYELEKTRAFPSSFCIERKAAVTAVHKESGKLDTVRTHRRTVFLHSTGHFAQFGMLIR